MDLKQDILQHIVDDLNAERNPRWYTIMPALASKRIDIAILDSKSVAHVGGGALVDRLKSNPYKTVFSGGWDCGWKYKSKDKVLRNIYRNDYCGCYQFILFPDVNVNGELYGGYTVELAPSKNHTWNFAAVDRGLHIIPGILNGDNIEAFFGAQRLDAFRAKIRNA
ncbi:MAG: hypothetical protein LBR41_02640 [Rickettsiales bacterium]|jgi:hypothetical protein|nr:hypothetical protein [Rickettsiales bacterium]